MTTQENRLAEIRKAIEAESVSLGELSELQDLAAEHPELFADDPALAEAAVIPEEKWHHWHVPALVRLGYSEESAKHAPGPWEVGYRNDGAPVVTSEARDVCLLETYYGDQQANARLIAAAPDLLEVARWSCAWANGWRPSKAQKRQHYENCLAAIDKAEGRAGE